MTKITFTNQDASFDFILFFLDSNFIDTFKLKKGN